MLVAYPHRPGTAAATDLAALQGARWVDLLNPTPDEIHAVEAAFHLRLPTRDALSEIEATSRLQQRDGVLYMSAPLMTGAHDDAWSTTPTGFVLSHEVFVTVRFAPLEAFDLLAKTYRDDQPDRSDAAFAALLDEIVDRAADHLEATALGLDHCSLAIFHQQGGAKRRLSHDTQQLRRVMTEVGRASERMSHARYTLVCLGRIAQFAADRGQACISKPVQERLQGVKTDIASLEQFEEHLLSRVQLLQDAATAFISIEQNDVVKVLTIASVAGIPPVLVVGIYGMNFKFMPELNWTWGYPFALGLIVVTTLVPLVWFKVKDWM